MKNTFSILFYLKRNNQKANGNTPILGRITVNGNATQFSTKVDVNPCFWNVKAGKAIGKTHEVNEVNATLESIKASMTKIFRDLREREHIVTPERIKNIFFGIENKKEQVTLLSLFTKHNDDYKKLVGTYKTSITYQRYERTKMVLEKFMLEKYNLADINLKEISPVFINDFDIYLKTTCRLSHNTVNKYMQRFKCIILTARNNGWLHTDPFSNHKISFKKTDRGYLDQQEVDAIMKKKFSIRRLEQVRDIFILACYTGLAYIDIKNLEASNIRPSFDGNLWIMTKRQKTNECIHVPLLEIAKYILDKYKGAMANGKALPVLSNQKMNAYLKEIADLCEIKKKLTFHLARHTFATTVTLANGVPIESVSKMLGHTNIKTTQIYARIIDSKISQDMLALSGKLKGIESNLAVTQ